MDLPIRVALSAKTALTRKLPTPGHRTLFGFVDASPKLAESSVNGQVTEHQNHQDLPTQVPSGLPKQPLEFCPTRLFFSICAERAL